MAALTVTLASVMAGATAGTAPATPELPYIHGKATEGATKSLVCSACHGENGNSVNPEWPRLAGQSAVYVAEQLRLFRAGVRTNPVMQPLAATLSDQDIDDLAVYYEAQTPSGLEADPSYWRGGEALYVRGYTGTHPKQASRNGVMMLDLAKRLTAEQIRDVASYVQGMR